MDANTHALRRAGRALSLAAALALVSNSLPAAAARTPAPRAPARRMTEEQRVVHVLNRLAFGARPGDVERVRRMGVEAYVEQQLNPAKLDDSALEARLKNFPTLGMSNAELLAKYPQPGRLLRRLQRAGELPPELASLAEGRGQGRAAENAMTQPGAGQGDADPRRRAARQAVARYMRENGLEPPQRIMYELNASRILRAVYSERQLQEVMVDFWTNHFNVFAQKGADRWFLTSYDRDVIRPNALGNFRDLLEATAKSPAMLFYLDNFHSVSPDARANGRMRRRVGREPRQGQAARQMPRPQRMRRGINENYARELMELHTLGVEGGYTQKDVQEVARAFTGWTIFAPRGEGAYASGGGEGRAGSFFFNPRTHDAGEKTVLGVRIPAGGGVEDGRKVLDILVAHPSTAKLIATKLCSRFVADEPDPALVRRVADAFRRSGGDIRAALRAVFASPEFNSAEARRAKVKTPFELAASALRTLDAEVEARPALVQWVARMGEPLYGYQAPTGYPDAAEYWVNTGALLERLNFSLALVSNRIPGARVRLSRFVEGGAAPGRAPDRGAVVESFLRAVLQGDISPQSREVLMKQLADGADAPGDAEVARIAALVIGSPEFQRQ